MLVKQIILPHQECRLNALVLHKYDATGRNLAGQWKNESTISQESFVRFV